MKFILPTLIMLASLTFSVAQDTRFNNVVVSGGGNGVTVRALSEDGETTYTNVGPNSLMSFDQDSGLHVKTGPSGEPMIYSGSHWYRIVAGTGGVSNNPSGAQDIVYAMSTNHTVLTWDTNTSPWTLYFPYIPGPTGPRGYNGIPFAYAGGYNCETTYSVSQCVTYAGGMYGCVYTNWLAEDCTSGPPDHVTAWVQLSSPGEDGTDGADGYGLPDYGNWSALVQYPTNIMVRGDGGLYKSINVSSNINPSTATNASLYWLLRLADGGNGTDGLILSNAYFATGITYNVNGSYIPNQAVSDGYSLFLCIQSNSPVNQHYTTDPNYWKQVVGRGAAGSNGINGVNGVNGVGNIYWDGTWQVAKNYTNLPVLVVYNDRWYWSQTGGLGAQPDLYTSTWKRVGTDGADGANWIWDTQWQIGYNYGLSNVVVVSNIAYKSIIADNSGNEPWLNSDKWTPFFRPDYRLYTRVNSWQYPVGAPYTNGMLVRHSSAVWEVLTDGISSEPSAGNTNYVAFVPAGERGPSGTNTLIVIYTNSDNYTTIYHPTNTVGTNTVTITNVAATAFTDGISNWFGFVGTQLTIRFKTNDSSGTTGTTITNIGTTLTGNGNTTSLNVSATITTQAWQGAQAYSWSNHAEVGYATGTPLYAYTETDPDFNAWKTSAFPSDVAALVESVAVTNASVLTYAGSNLVSGPIAINTNDFSWDGSALSSGVPSMIDSLSAYVGDLYVAAQWGNDSNDGTTWQKAKLTIQAAVDSSVTSNSIYVAPGLYSAVDVSGATCSIHAISAEISGIGYDWAVTGLLKKCSIEGFRITGTNGIVGVVASNCMIVGTSTNSGTLVAHSSIYRCDVSRGYSVVVNSYVHDSTLYGGRQLVLDNVAGYASKFYRCWISSFYVKNSYGVIDGTGGQYGNWTSFYNCNLSDLYQCGNAGYVIFYAGFFDCNFCRMSGPREILAGLRNLRNCSFRDVSVTQTNNTAPLLNFALSSGTNNVFFGCAARSIGSPLVGTVNIGFRTLPGTAITNTFDSSLSLNADLIQRVSGRHYFGAEYIGANTNTGLTVSTNLTVASLTVGYVPIRSDGTNYFVAPFGTNLYFQLSTNQPSY